MAWAWRHTVAMDWLRPNGRKITATLTGESLEVSVAKNKGCQMAWAWRHTVAMDWLRPNGRKIRTTLTAESLEVSVAKYCLQGGGGGHFITR